MFARWGALVAALFGAASDAKLLLKKNQATALTDKVSFNGEEIFGSDLGAGGKEVGKCYKSSKSERLESVTVCGVNMKLGLYLVNDCETKDPHQVEVGSCDAGSPSSTCVSINGDKKGDYYWIDSALSYKIMPCDSQGEAKVDDAPPINVTSTML